VARAKLVVSATIEAAVPAEVASAVVRVSAAEVSMMGWLALGIVGRARVPDWCECKRVDGIAAVGFPPQLRFVAFQSPHSERNGDEDDDGEKNESHRSTLETSIYLGNVTIQF
jgi:hypothetical protein